MTNQKALTACATAIFLLSTGCHVYHPDPVTPPTRAAQALDELQSLPSLEETQTQVQSAINEITTAAAAIVADVTWTTPHQGSADNCQAPYEKSDGKRYFMPDQIAPSVTVSEMDWAKILNTAKASAAKLGATNQQVMQDGPANHDVGFYGPSGLFIKIAYKGNLVVSGYTGCRLPQDKKQPT